jgi:hypothetical protein
MTILARVPTRSTPRSSSQAWQLRHLIIRSNQWLAARLPASWVYWFAFPHEFWHYLAARALGLRARIVPGVTLFEPAPRWQTALVLVAPAALGLVMPVTMHMLLQAAAGNAALVDWPVLALSLLGWWAGCAGDLVDLCLLPRRDESREAHRLRTERILARLDAAQAWPWQPALQLVVVEPNRLPDHRL